MPPSVTIVPPAQSIPSVSEQFAAPVGGGAQVPCPAPASLFTLQIPLQHCVPESQTSPFWRQNEDALQSPPVHSPEQQSPLPAHVLLSVLHVVLSGMQLPPVHTPLQHAASPVHAWPS